MIDLLDVNVLVSLAWPNHVHHRAAQSWFGDGRSKRWATTPVTQAGFVRVSSNSAALPGAASPRAAMALLGEITELDGHEFLPDDVAGIVGEDAALAARVVGSRLVTDAHLLALAQRYGGRLVTFDRGLRELAGASRAAHLRILGDGGRR